MRKFVLPLFLALCLAFAAAPLVNSLSGGSVKDYRLWYQTGQNVLKGGDIYPARAREKFDFMYPPPCALFLAPASALGQNGLIFVLAALTGVAWYICIRLTATILGLQQNSAEELVVLFDANFVVLPFIWGTFFLGQPSLVLLALVLGGLRLLQLNRPVLGGTLFALATCIKAFPIVVLIYLIYRRCWVATLSMVGALAFCLFVLPLPFRGVERTKQDLTRWSQGMVRYDERGVAQRAGRSHSWKNQSIFGVANRLLRRVESDFQWAPHTPVYSNFANLSFRTVNGIIIGCALIFGLTYVAAMPRKAARTPRSDALEFAALISLMLIFTPLAFGYLFCWLMVPFAVAFQKILADPTRRLTIGLILVAVVCLVLTLFWHRTAQTYGSLFFGTCALFFAVMIELWRERAVAIQLEE